MSTEGFDRKTTEFPDVLDGRESPCAASCLLSSSPRPEAWTAVLCVDSVVPVAPSLNIFPA